MTRRQWAVLSNDERNACLSKLLDLDPRADDDWVADLNAVARALKSMPSYLRPIYHKHLYEILGGSEIRLLEWNWVYHVATAAERAEALALTYGSA